jgi:hypothetical protein
MSLRFFAILLLPLVWTPGVSAFDEPRPDDPLPAEARTLLNTFCLKCHQGEKAKAKLDLSRFQTTASLKAEPKIWGTIIARVRDGEMPPAGNPAPTPRQREQFVDQTRKPLIAAVRQAGPKPGPAPLRRLNRTEYAATLRDLLGSPQIPTQSLPEDGAGGEGFDNSAETLFLSPLHAEKYLTAAREALDYAAKDPRSSRTFLVAKPGPGTTDEQAAREILEKFLPRAFRRPARDKELDSYLELFAGARKRGDTFEQSILFALQGVLISPHFLFRIEESNPDAKPRLVGEYEIASRLSYFLWASGPDDTLYKLAGEGKLNKPEALREQATRMLKDRKARESVESFVEQWLGTRELGRNVKPDRALNPRYTNELEWSFKQEPVSFFQGMLAENRSLLDLIDSNYTYVDSALARHYGLKATGLKQQMTRFDLPEGSNRGGLLGMAGVLTVSSLPHRTSPVLRGKWVRETLLGSTPPPPPADVPALDPKKEAAKAKSIRELLETHRRNAVCASCHNSIDPIGFGLENYDLLGRWRTEDAGEPIDAKGELLDGTKFDGPRELKKVLLQRKDDFVRQLTTKMLGYALGRGLTVDDLCTVEEIVEKVKEGDYRSQVLVAEIVCSVPFRYRAAAGDAKPTKAKER